MDEAACVVGSHAALAVVTQSEGDAGMRVSARAVMQQQSMRNYYSLSVCVEPGPC